jgi:nicotinamidase-related amidase
MPASDNHAPEGCGIAHGWPWFLIRQQGRIDKQEESRLMQDTVYGQFQAREDCLLLLVDVQKSMPDLRVHKEQVLKNCAAVIDVAAILEIPVIFSQHNAEKLGGVLPKLVAKVRGPVIRNKLEFSGFENEELARTLENIGRWSILLAGLETHVCIFHTGAHGARLGYRVHLAADAVTSRGLFNWKKGVRCLERAGVVISSTEMIIFELRNRARTPEFRKALSLLKTL